MVANVIPLIYSNSPSSSHATIERVNSKLESANLNRELLFIISERQLSSIEKKPSNAEARANESEFPPLALSKVRVSRSILRFR